MTTKEIENKLFRYFNRSIAVIDKIKGLHIKGIDKIDGVLMRIPPAIYHECDILAVSEARYATEVEIKISISDLKADFKKEHNHKSEVIKNFYYCIPENLLEKALPIIPLKCGILLATERGIIKHRACKINKKARVMTDKEVAEIWRLSMFRYWNLR